MPNSQTSIALELHDHRRSLALDLSSEAEEIADHLEREVELVSPCEKWIVWPAIGDVEPREEELACAGIRVVGFKESDGFEFRVGRGF